MHTKTLTMTTGLLIVLGSFAMAPGSALDLGGPDMQEIDDLSALDQERLIEGGHDHWIVAFTELPDARDEYGGAPIVNVDEDLRHITVRTQDIGALQETTGRDATVRYVEWDNPLYAVLQFTPNDARYDDEGHWGSKRIGAEEAWDLTLGSTAVKIAMVDSGLNRDHEEYAGESRVLQGHDFRDNDDNPADTSQCSWHGTHTTGTAAATIDNDDGIAGLAQASILPVRIFGPDVLLGLIAIGCSTSTSAVVDGLKYAADEGAHVSSNSWGGGGSSSSINDAIQYAHDKGTIHVAAAGNSGSCTNCVSQPWKDNADKTLVVSSSNTDDGLSSFSSEGPEVTLIAPGSDILSSTSGTSGYSSLSGTSMAAPHVTGTAALVLAGNPGWGFNDVRDRLVTTAEDLGLSEDRQGAGLVRADLAVSPE